MFKFHSIFIITLFSMFLCWACGEKKDLNLEKATKIHNEASAIHDSLEAMTGKITDLEKKLIEKKSTFSEKDSSIVLEIDVTIEGLHSAVKDMEEWEENIVEVPGNEHHHHGNEHEHHEHKPAPDVTPEQMLAIQTEMKEDLIQIQEVLIRNIERAEAVLSRK